MLAMKRSIVIGMEYSIMFEFSGAFRAPVQKAIERAPAVYMFFIGNISFILAREYIIPVIIAKIQSRIDALDKNRVAVALIAMNDAIRHMPVLWCIVK